MSGQKSDYILRYDISNAISSLTDLELAVLRVLKNGKQTPRNIAKTLDKSDPQIMHILRSLKVKGIITSESGEGRRVYYKIKDENAWIALAIEFVDLLNEYDNRIIKQFLSDKSLNEEQKKLAIMKYFELREKMLPIYFSTVAKNILEELKTLSH